MLDINQKCCSQQMKQYLRDFLENIKFVIKQIKANVYKAAKIQCLNFSHKNVIIYPNLPSIFKNFNQIHQDLKKIHLILKGITFNHQQYIPQSNKKQNYEKNKNQINYNNITFQNFITNSKTSQSKFDPIITDSLKFSLQNQQNKVQNKINKNSLNSKIHLRNKTEVQILKIPSDKQLTDVQSIGECITKRTNFSTIRIKSPSNISKDNANSINQVSNLSIKDSKSKQSNNKFQNEHDNENQIKKDQSQFFTFNKIQKVQQSYKNSFRSPRMVEDSFKRSSQCFRLIKSIRKQLSR